MFVLTAAANDTSRRADPVADLDRGLFVLGQIELSVILNAYSVYPFVHVDKVKLTRFSPVSHSSSWINVDYVEVDRRWFAGID